MKRLIIILIISLSFTLYAQKDSVRIIQNDSILREISTLKAIQIKAPRPIYSMDAGVVNYNVANDETIKGGNALDALRNAPSVEVDVEGNVLLRGSSKVQIWLNGYPTYMNGQSLQIYLTSLSAEVIDHIEVIKNPSAEYMVADGTAIINIVMRAKLRRNQFLALGLSGNNRPYASPWASYVYDGDKLDFNVYLAPSISHHNTASQGTSFSFKDSSNGGFDTIQSQSWNTTDTSQDYFSMLNLGLTYMIDSMNDLTFNSFSLFQGFISHSSDDRYRADYMPAFQSLHYVTGIDNNSISANGFSTLTYRHKFDNSGHNLSFVVNANWWYSSYNTKTIRLFEDFCPNELLMSKLRKYTIDPSFSLRYRKPIGERDYITFGAGFSPNRSKDLSINHYFDSSSMSYSQSDMLRNRVVCTRDREEYLSLNWRHQTKVFSTTLGIMAESHQIAYSVQSVIPDSLLLTYIALRPTFNFTYHTKSMHYFSVNYTLSSSHPSPTQLSQSPVYQYDSYSIGNPMLKPYLSHKADVSWNKYFKSGSSVSVEAYGEWKDNAIESIQESTSSPDPYLDRIISYSTYYNIGRNYKYGMESNITYRINAFLRFGVYANLYYSAYQINHPKIGLYGDSALTYDLRLNCSAKLFKKININLSGDYTSPTINPFAEKRTSYTVDLSATADFFDNRLSVRFSISDLFNWHKTNIINTNPYYMTTESTHRDSRFITMGVTYRIGKMNLQYRTQTGAGMQ